MTDQDRPVHAPEVELVPSAGHEVTEEERQYTGAHDAGDREWTHDPLERSFFSTVGRGYAIGIIVFGLFAFLIARTQAPDWGFGAALGAAAFVAFFAGVLGGVVLIGLWAMKNEELIRGNETGDTNAPGWVVDTSHEDGAGGPGAAPGPHGHAHVDRAGGRRRRIRGRHARCREPRRRRGAERRPSPDRDDRGPGRARRRRLRPPRNLPPRPPAPPDGGLTTPRRPGGATATVEPMRSLQSFSVRPALPPELSPLERLAMNLRWSWDEPTRDLFRWVDKDAWEAMSHDPVRLLGQVPRPRLDQLAADPGFLRYLQETEDGLGRYLDRSPLVPDPRRDAAGQPAPARGLLLAGVRDLGSPARSTPAAWGCWPAIT